LEAEGIETHRLLSSHNNACALMGTQKHRRPPRWADAC
jgi:hypothetical protein